MANVVTMPPRPEPAQSVAASIEGDQIASLVSSVAKGLNHALAKGGGPNNPSGWIAGVLVAVGLAMVGGLLWLGVQVQGLRASVDEFEGYAPRIEVVERRQDRIVEALISAQDAQLIERRWSQSLLRDLWSATYPNREPPPIPASEPADRKILSLER